MSGLSGVAVLGVTACSAGVEPMSGLTFGSGNPVPGGETGTDTDGSGSDTADEGTAANDTVDDGDGGTNDGSCSPGVSETCYGGPAGTDGVGRCRQGTRTCDPDGRWGACEGEVVPEGEACNGLDDDCNGTPDDTPADATCNTGLAGPCAQGTEVCAGGEAICEPDLLAPPPEVCGNGVDDDCNGAVDDGCNVASCDPMNPAPACGAGQHCFPQPDDMPVCQGPTGGGTQYVECQNPGQCAPEFHCQTTPFGTTYCLEWCTDDFDCPNAFDFCIFFDPPMLAGGTEYGLCYDGDP